MYDHTKQYRCTIVRGKSQKEIDNLLPAYAKVIDEICPCGKDDFPRLFNEHFEVFLEKSDVSNDVNKKKTLDNHRTEIAGKLFGMYYLSSDGYYYESERTNKFLQDNDQPAFFKDVCYKMQFPNGLDKENNLEDKIAKKLNLRPNSFVVKLLQEAEKRNLKLTTSDIGYYVLNSLDVLQGNAEIDEVLNVIANDRKNGIERKVKTEGKASSYDTQHIREQLNYLELANLIRITKDKYVVLNPLEKTANDIFASKWNQNIDFDVYKYDISTIENRKKFYSDWGEYFGRISDEADNFSTSSTALLFSTEQKTIEKIENKKESNNLVEFGDEGERVVFEYEKQRVGKFNSRLANKVISFGKTRGIGYDIQSVIAEKGEMAEFVKYIEVKSTKRYTKPDLNDDSWTDTLNITRNEWVAASQHKDFYSIYRVYFTSEGIFIYTLDNPKQKLDEEKLELVPMTYRMDFGKLAVDSVINPTYEAGVKNV